MSTIADPRDVIVAPVISEKSYEQITQNQYTFRVHKDAHKTQVRQAVEEIFVELRGAPLLLFYKVGPSPSRWWGMVASSDKST